MLNIALKLSEEIGSTEHFVKAAIQLLDEGATVPFVARYRKEVTGGLDDVQLRNLDERLSYLRELEDRKLVVLKSITEQDKLTPELQKSVENADSKTLLEDIYRPYVQKRRTKAQIAKEAGLESLAFQLLEDQSLNPENVAQGFINADKAINTTIEALDGAKQILMEHFSDNPELTSKLRDYLWDNAKVKSNVVEGKEQEGIKFSDYFDAAEAISAIPSHRSLALFRGRNEGFLTLTLTLDEENEPVAINNSQTCVNSLANHFNINADSNAGKWLNESARWAWRVKLSTRLDTELKLRLREDAEQEAINVFSQNLHSLLMASPAGPRATIGLDPAYRTGVKIAIVDNTGKFLENTVVYPHQPQNQYSQAIEIIATLIRKHNIDLASIGNGTASRETDRLVADLSKKYPELNLNRIVVSEAGASVYSASELAAEEFPDLDVTVRGAISIARRLQDPLAELVKIDPKAIGVGQYQHDVNQSKLAKSLSAVVEDCVNAVGVDVNMASAALLTHVSGLNSTLAKNVVAFRDKNGKFKERKQLLKVPRLGEKAYEQCAGFLRIMDGTNPLDASTVHPEAYPLVERIINTSGTNIKHLIGDSKFLKQLNPKDYSDESFGEPTIIDILTELEKPGRDPRPEFKSATFKEGVEKMSDLQPGMILEGVITNVTNFGAFVDIGVHQDGLVHISVLADKFVKDPQSVVKTGEVVKVKVVEVDLQRKRIALSMRLNESVRDNQAAPKSAKSPNMQRKPHQQAQPEANNAFAQAFANAKK
ncbi:MAG: RNA-binding transcriptional accessory protein [Gammaproteobacteria bacterium]|nr:RNA-binding transcriptional accessory protein [Gammaproteobacteria bacterium]